MNRISVFAVVLLSVAVFGQGGPPGAARQVGRPTGASLAELVPASTGVFIEFADLQSHYPPSGSPAVWRAAVKLIGLEGDPVGDGGVGGPIGSQLGLSTESAVAALFGRRVAVALPSMGRLEEGVLLARLPGPRGLGTVLKAGPWESRRARGRLRYYVLDSGLSMATDGRTVVIGQDLPEHPFMRSCLDLLGRRKGRSLAAAKPFIMLTERFPDRCAGLAYVDWGGGEGPGSVAVPGSGLLFAALRRGAVACVAGEDGLHLELSAEAADRAGVMAFGAARGGGAGRPALPKDIWLAATVDASPGELLTWVHSKSASGPGALFIQLLGGAMVGAQPDDNLMDYLEAPTTLVVGVPQRSGAGLGRPGLPRAALVMGTQDAAGALRVFDQAMERLIHFVNLRVGGPGGEGDGAGRLQVETDGGPGVPARYVSLAPLAGAGDPDDPRRELQLAWGVAGGYFVVASQAEYLGEVRSALREGPGVAGPTREELDRRFAEAPWLSMDARLGKLAVLATQWLAYVARDYPEVLADEGWSSLLARRREQRVELGAGLKADPNQPGKVRVVRTFRGWPADGVLQAGDSVVGYQGRLLALEDPLADLRAALAGRAGEAVTLRIERGGRLGDVEVRLRRPVAASGPGENPLLALEPLLALARAIERVDLSVTPSAGLLCAEVEVRFAPAPSVTTVSPASN